MRWLSPSLNPCCSGRWSRTNVDRNTGAIDYSVLILVVVEDGLVHNRFAHTMVCEDVLILVVVEDGLVLDLIRLF